MVTPVQLNPFIFLDRSLFRPIRSPELFRLTGVKFDQQEVQNAGSVVSSSVGNFAGISVAFGLI
jgi:hypothetical protein